MCNEFKGGLKRFVVSMDVCYIEAWMAKLAFLEVKLLFDKVVPLISQILFVILTDQ